MLGPLPPAPCTSPQLRHTHGCLQAVWQLSRQVAVNELRLQEAAAQVGAAGVGAGVGGGVSESSAVQQRTLCCVEVR